MKEMTLIVISAVAVTHFLGRDKHSFIMAHSKSGNETAIVEISSSNPGHSRTQENSHISKEQLTLRISNGSTGSSPSALGTSSSESEILTTPPSDSQSLEASDQSDEDSIHALPNQKPRWPRKRRASTTLISSSPNDIRRIFGEEAGTQFLGRICCGGGCCSIKPGIKTMVSGSAVPVQLPDSDAYRSLQLNLGPLGLDLGLTSTVDVPEQTVSFERALHPNSSKTPITKQHPPKFVTPHPPYEVYPARLHHARELTRPGAEKRTYHFDLDVTDYPKESGDVDFVVGGAVGVCAPNSDELVTELFNILNIPKYVRDQHVILRTTKGRWPTIWGDEMARELATTRRELLTWCSDLQSYPPTKPLLRLLAEYATEPSEKKILLYLSSAEGQGAFCDLRTGPHITMAQLLNAFPSSQPPLELLLSTLNTLMPRFYSLSQDPQISCTRQGESCRRLIEIAVTIHETPNWRGGPRTGVASGYLERLARRVMDAEANGTNPADLNLHVPMFRGLMANPLAREFVSDGPMLLIGAGVGIAPFRGFVQRRLKSANCANKVWVLQGVRDSLLDELYSGEWGVEEAKVKKVVESRKGEGRYVQEEVRLQADLVWFVINAVDGRVFVCGSSKGMGEGVEMALVDVAIEKGGLNKEGAEEFWKRKKEVGQFIAVSYLSSALKLLVVGLVMLTAHRRHGRSVGLCITKYERLYRIRFVSMGILSTTVLH